TFTFNDTVDPATVNFSSISIIDKATGVSPTGSFIVNGRVVIFRPTLIESDSGLQFGFRSGSTYRLQVLDDSSANAIAATSGRLNQTFITGDITISPAADLNPGDPALKFTTPDETTVPDGRDFEIVLCFNDVMQTLPMANPDTGASSLITVTTFDSSTGVELPVPGRFTAVIDRDAILTTVTFASDIPFPGNNGGSRVLRVGVSPQIVDLVGNNLSNPGVRILLLPVIAQTPGALSESFADNSQEDEGGSTAGLWAGVAGALDSGQDPLTGLHHGGGSGALGKFQPETGLFNFDTDLESAFTSELLGEDIAVLGGVFPFTEIDIEGGVRVEADGTNPLRLLAQGSVQVDGVIDLSGEDAPTHRGKVFFFSEWDNDSGVGGGSGILESALGTISDFGGDDDNALGGAPGLGRLGAGSGGTGGKAWYHQAVSTVPGASIYLDSDEASWQDELSGAFSHNLARFNDGMLGSIYSGSNAEGVGGTPALGQPAAGDFNLLHDDQDNGSGMGSWCWPPRSNVLTNSGLGSPVTITTHPTAFSGGSPTDFGDFAIHRSRGGGGGGYWTDGSRGTHFENSATNALGAPLFPDLEPLIDADDDIREFNGDGLGGDHIFWDALNPSPELPDADGGRYVPAPGIETLDPNASLLLGGSGGGGAGMSEHGSIEDRFDVVNGQVGTYRNNPGGGGGAGGGAIQVHAGSRLTVNGSILLDGGHGADSEFMIAVPFGDTAAIDFGPPGDAGGGGGSGGAALMQGGSQVQVNLDAISVNGGSGGIGAAGNHGGDGGGGLVRFETATGSESLSTLEGFVTPDTAVDLTPIGMPGVANVSTLSMTFPGFTGDVQAGDGTIFNGNASGVRSRWNEPSPSVQNIIVTGWQVEVEYFDGAVQNLSFSDASPTDPDSTPIWIAFQGGWLAPGESQLPEPSVVSSTSWVVPSVNGATDGIDELNAAIIRSVRYQLVFDHDQINALITGVAGGYFRVTSVNIDFLGD
ncbi:MAG: Ig-like domain-containing domain, partial [Planctomycetota bacterium]